MFEFQWPWMFVLLLLPWLLWYLLLRYAPESRMAVPAESSSAVIIPLSARWQTIERQGEESASLSLFSRRFVVQSCLLLGWGLLVAAAARPVWVDEIGTVPVSNRNIMVAVDLSGSMAQRDFRLKGSRISRLAATKKVASHFIEKRVGDRIGLILFADHAYLQAPLTRDRRTVIRLLNEAELGLAGERTALGNAIGLTVKKIREQPDEEHVLVVMTDGAATVGVTVAEATRFALEAGLKVYTIGIGSSGVRVGSDLDEVTLQRIAEKTGGRYFRAKSIDEMEAIYQELDKLEPVIDLSQAWYPVKDWFYWPLALGCLLLLGAALVASSVGMKTGRRPE